MKKKIIKFCFFSDNFREPAVKYLSFFSKRAIKAKKQIQRYQTALKKKHRLSRESVHKLITHRRLILSTLYYNQWTLQSKKLKTFFINSYFKKKFRNRRRIFQLWFSTRKRYNTTTYRFIRNYANKGIISSHFVHFLLVKNMVYQSRSKYKSKIYDTSAFSYYVYFCTKLIQMHSSNIQKNLFQFTSNFSKTNVRMNEDFTISVEGWLPHTPKLQYSHKNTGLSCNLNKDLLVINPTLFNLDSFQTLNKHRDAILKFTTESDPNQQEINRQKLLATLEPSTVILFNYVVNMYIYNRIYIPTQLHAKYIFKQLSLYKDVY